MAGAGDDIHYCHLQCLQQYCRHAYAPAQVAVAVVLAAVNPVLVILNFQFRVVKKLDTVGIVGNVEELGTGTFMPYPCSHFYFDINFGDRLYSKEKRPSSPFLF